MQSVMQSLYESRCRDAGKERGERMKEGEKGKCSGQKTEGRASRSGEMGAAGDGVYLCRATVLHCTNVSLLMSDYYMRRF